MQMSMSGKIHIDAALCRIVCSMLNAQYSNVLLFVGGNIVCW